MANRYRGSFAIRFALLAAFLAMTLASCDRVKNLWQLFRGSLAARRSPSDATTPTPKDVERHEDFLRQKAGANAGVLFLGDSITDWWPKVGARSWSKLEPLRPLNFGISGDKTENLLWRVLNGELRGIHPGVVVVLIGTNNVGHFPDEQPAWAAAGIGRIIEVVHERLPDARIVLLGVLPRGAKESHERSAVVELNRLIRPLDGKNGTLFLDAGAKFIDPAGNIPPRLMPDGLHLSAEGYDILFDQLQPVLERLANSG